MKELQPHQQRVVEEKEQLDEKKSKLQEFIETNKLLKTLPDEEKSDLKRQLYIMEDYSQILGKRITRFYYKQ